MPLRLRFSPGCANTIVVLANCLAKKTSPTANRPGNTVRGPDILTYRACHKEWEGPFRQDWGAQHARLGWMPPFEGKNEQSPGMMAETRRITLN